MEKNDGHDPELRVLKFDSDLFNRSDLLKIWKDKRLKFINGPSKISDLMDRFDWGDEEISGQIEDYNRLFGIEDWKNTPGLLDDTDELKSKYREAIDDEIDSWKNLTGFDRAMVFKIKMVDG